MRTGIILLILASKLSVPLLTSLVTKPLGEAVQLSSSGLGQDESCPPQASQGHHIREDADRGPTRPPSYLCCRVDNVRCSPVLVMSRGAGSGCSTAG